MHALEDTRKKSGNEHRSFKVYSFPDYLPRSTRDLRLSISMTMGLADVLQTCASPAWLLAVTVAALAAYLLYRYYMYLDIQLKVKPY